jgi:hypothetical protein
MAILASRALLAADGAVADRPPDKPSLRLSYFAPLIASLT